MRGFLQLIAILILLPLSFCVALPIALTGQWGWEIAQLYKHMEHPTGTERLFFDFRTGHNTSSNSNDCDFVMLEARSYQLADKEKIRSFYTKKRIKITKQYDKEIGFNFSEDADFTFSGVEREWLNKVKQSYHKPFYIIYDAIDGPENLPPFIDWRCT